MNLPPPPLETSSEQEVLRTIGKRSPKARRRRLFLRLGVALTCALGLGYAGWHYFQERALAALPVYKTEALAQRTLSVTVGTTGTLEGLNTVEVGSEVSGKITELLVDFNDVVKEGQTLAVIDPEQSQAAVDEALANVTSSDAAVLEAQATLEEAKLNAERARQQLKEGLLSQQEHDSLIAAEKRAQAAIRRSRASATLARASLKSAQSRLTKTTIVSPINGIVQSRLVEVGQTLTAGMSTPVLFKLTEDLRKMRLSVSIDEADIGRVREGQTASFTVDAYPEKVFGSEVLSIRNEPTTDQNVVTYEAILAVQNDERLLRPGMTATATITTETKKDVLSVPNTALRFSPQNQSAPRGFGPMRGPAPKKEKGGAGVWILAAPQAEAGPPAPQRVELKAGVTDGRYSEVVSSDSLKLGSEVIVDVETPHE